MIGICLANEWNTEELEDWGLEGFPFGRRVDSEEFGN
jgi:hypothetical protein